MTITTLDGALAGMLPGQSDYVKNSYTGQAAGVLHSTFLTAGFPGAGSSPGGGINGTFRSSPYNGTIVCPAAVAGKKLYIARAEFEGVANALSALVADRLWDNTFTVTSTSSQAIATSGPVARDTDASTNGRGWQIAVEVYATVGAAAPNVTVTYTNSAGTAGQVTPATALISGAVAGTFIPIPLAAGDVGVRTPTAVQLSASWLSGTAGLVLYRPVCRVGTPVAGANNDRNLLDLGFPVVHDSSCLWVVHRLGGTAVGASAGSISFAQG